MASFANKKASRKKVINHESLFRVMLSGSCMFSTEQPFMKKRLLQFEQAEHRAVAGQSLCESLCGHTKGLVNCKPESGK